MRSELETENPALELEGVDVPAYSDPRAVVVRDVQWRVEEGDCWLILGPARSGKSSVLGVAAGLIRPFRGRHWLFGVEMAGLSESERTLRRLRVGVVFGGGGRLFPTLTVLQNLTLPLEYHGNALGDDEADRVLRLLEVLGLRGYEHRYPAELPRWVSQRVGLARALALRPELLLLDEPVMGLGAGEETWWRRFVEGDRAAALGAELMPKTWVVAASEGRVWDGWAGRCATVESGKWREIEARDCVGRPHPEG